MYYKNGKVFSDGIFEANQASQYKVISSQSELQAFSLLNHDEAETDVFDNNYYVSNKNVKENIEILDTVRESSYPYIAIHLDKVIETDYIANNFKYENGEIYITIEIFEKTEMTYLHEVPSNLLIVSLRSVVFEEDKIGEPENTLDDIYDDISPDCKINVTFENVVAMDN